MIGVGLKRFALGLSSMLAALALVMGPQAGAAENEFFGVQPFPDQVEGVERHNFSIPLEQGAVFEDAVRVYNRTDQPLTLAIYAADANAGLDGTITASSRGSELEGVGSWIDLTETAVTLPGTPRGEAIVHFRVTVRSANPAPKLGAIVVEDTTTGVRPELTKREKVVVFTTPPASPTASRRVRPFLLRSPWIIVAIVGLLVAGLLVWFVTRRGRRPEDAVIAAGELSDGPDAGTEPDPSRPKLHRLGAAEDAEARRERRRAARTERERTRDGRSREGDRAQRPGAKDRRQAPAEGRRRRRDAEESDTLPTLAKAEADDEPVHDDDTEGMPEADERPLLDLGPPEDHPPESVASDGERGPHFLLEDEPDDEADDEADEDAASGEPPLLEPSASVPAAPVKSSGPHGPRTRVNDDRRSSSRTKIAPPAEDEEPEPIPVSPNEPKDEPKRSGKKQAYIPLDEL